jgi:hypothetical protein
VGRRSDPSRAWLFACWRSRCRDYLIENFFARLKQYRAIATRYDKTDRRIGQPPKLTTYESKNRACRNRQFRASGCFTPGCCKSDSLADPNRSTCLTTDPNARVTVLGH